MPSKSIVGKLNKAQKRKYSKDQINIVRDEKNALLPKHSETQMHYLCIYIR